MDETPIKITIGGTVIPARLADNPTARDLAAQLPLTLTFKDFNQVEKLARLPRRLSMDGVPAGADPDMGDIGYYAPSGDLVFYYEEEPAEVFVDGRSQWASPPHAPSPSPGPR